MAIGRKALPPSLQAQEVVVHNKRGEVIKHGILWHQIGLQTLCSNSVDAVTPPSAMPCHARWNA